MSRRGFCAAMAMCLAWMGASARGASGTLIEARGILSGQTTAIVTIPSASSGDSTGTVQLSSSSGTGRGRAGITAAGIELGASGVHTGAGFAGGTAIVEDSMGVFNVINTSGFDGAVLKLDLSGSLSSAGGAPAILSVSASDWIRTNGTLGGFSGGQWFYDGSAFWNDFATGNASSIAGLPENGNWFSSGGA
jgi:hypothetical protein